MRVERIYPDGLDRPPKYRIAKGWSYKQYWNQTSEYWWSYENREHASKFITPEDAITTYKTRRAERRAESIARKKRNRAEKPRAVRRFF